MKYIDIPAYDGTLIHTSRIAMGSTMSMEGLNNDEKWALYDYYVDRGGNCIDTARSYGRGHAEEMVGEYMRLRKNRNRLIISTKGGHPTDENPGVSRVTKKDILADLETSLSKLGTDYVDYYWIHKDDASVPAEELADIISEIVRQGKARRVGVSNFTTERIAAIDAAAAASDGYGVGASQIQWSLPATEDKYFAQFDSLVMTPKRYDYYLKNNIPVFAFSSQAQGFFARVEAQGLDAQPEGLREQYGSADNMKRFEKVKAMAAEKNTSVSAIGLAYIINNRLPGAAIIGSQSIDMLSQSLDAADVEMTAEEADELYRV